MKREYYSYNNLVEDLRLLVKKIDKEFDTIIPIARGGLTIAHLLSEHYDIRRVYAINTVGYDNSKKLDRVEVFNIPNLKDTKRALIVDDIVDSGDTLIAVLDILKRKYPDIIFYTASIFHKKSAKISPLWFVKKTDEWIDFFWTEDI